MRRSASCDAAGSARASPCALAGRAAATLARTTRTTAATRRDEARRPRSGRRIDALEVFEHEAPLLRAQPAQLGPRGLAILARGTTVHGRTRRELLVAVG